MSIQGKNHIITKAGNFIVTNDGCMVMSFLYICSIYIKILRTRIEEYIHTITIKFQENIE